MGYKSIGSNISDLLNRLERDGHIIIHRKRARSIEIVNKSEFDRGFAAGRLSILSEIEAKHCSPVVQPSVPADFPPGSAALARRHHTQ